MNITQGFKQGLIILAVLFYLDVIGIPLFVGGSVFWVLAVIVGLFSFNFVRKANLEEPKPFLHALVHSLVIGVVAAVGFALVTFVFARLYAQGLKVSDVFAQIKPDNVAALTGTTVPDVRKGLDVTPGLIRLALYMAAGGFAGGVLARLLIGRGSTLMKTGGVQKVKTW